MESPESDDAPFEMPVDGRVIQPAFTNPQTAAGQQTLDLCRKYIEGTPDDLYVEQIPPARRELVRRYFDALRQAVKASGHPTTRPAASATTQP
ncbi:MAG: hypothetical protein V2A79_02415 [Planctomycetota bacterium]